MSILNEWRPRKGIHALSYAAEVFEAINTPTSLCCHLLLKYGEHEQLARKSIDPLHYSSAGDFFASFQSIKLLSKFPNLKTGIDLKKEAQKNFLSAEASCLQTNARFRSRCSEGFSPRVERVISYAQRKIAAILGDVPCFEDLKFEFGPGASYGVRGDTSVHAKTSSDLECTYAMLPVLREFLEEFPGWVQPGVHDVKVVQGSELTFVPKDAKTDRPICIEPLLNGLYQKGFGAYIRDRLKRHGIDLKNQTVNQRLAQSAYAESLSTVDFRSASDTIAYGLVLDLLPLPWFEALDVARSPSFFYDGCWYPFQKFTSMGNAYTFELESLIFYGLAFACAQELGIVVQTGVNLSVYGDDVIIPRGSFDLFAEVSTVCGFTVNKDKSFKDGPFFESCGADYFRGTPVRPILLKRELNALPETYYAINSLSRISRRWPLGPHRMATRRRLRRLHSRMVDSIPRKLRFFGPEGFGDGHIVANFDESRPQRHAVFDGWQFPSVLSVPRRRRIVDSVSSGYALYPSSPSSGIKWYRTSLGLFSQADVSLSSDRGTSYELRGPGRLVKRSGFCFFEQWPNFDTSSGWYGDELH